MIEAINNFWILRANNRDQRVKFRFLTRSKIGVERGDLFGKNEAGLQIWRYCSGNEAAITKIAKFLQNEGKISEEVNDFLEQASPQEIYKQLIEPIIWETGGKDVSSVERSINDKLVLHGNRQPIPIPPSDAKKVVDRLLKEALAVATQGENRELTKVRFLEIFEEQTTQRVPTQYLQHLQMLATQAKALDNANAAFIGGSSDVAIQSYFPILDSIPPLYRDVFRRTDLLTIIQTKLQSNGIVIIQGGVDKGKQPSQN